MVEFTVRLGYAIFTVATLSFLGFGIQPPAPDWGLQVYEHYGLISGGYWWPVLFPALAIAILVVGVNLIADGIAKGVRAMTSAPVATEHALELEDLEVEYRVRGNVEAGPARGQPPHRRGRVLRARRRVRLRQVDRRLRGPALPAPQRAGEQGQAFEWRARTCWP